MPFDPDLRCSSFVSHDTEVTKAATITNAPVTIVAARGHEKILVKIHTMRGF